ncbi:SH3 domain-containing protein [Psychrobacillus sp. FSL K6-1267]|uniref:SH3 domain-containing protein n=1 Tax=Psychrobacillus sp. FSL K6-1267 TaxID=2921543 RepID=UPI0030F63405
MTITVKSVHIRSGPSASAKVLGYAFKGQKLDVKSLKNGWYSLGQGKYITANSAYSSLKKG